MVPGRSSRDHQGWPMPEVNGLNPRPYLLSVLLICTLPMQAGWAKDRAELANATSVQSVSPKGDRSAAPKNAIEGKESATTGRLPSESQPKGEKPGVPLIVSHPSILRPDTRPDSSGQERGAGKGKEQKRSPTKEGQSGSEAPKDDGATTVKPATDQKKGEDIWTAPIDTRIPEQSNHASPPPDKLGPLKAFTRPSIKPVPDGEIVRNAIGAQVTNHAARQNSPSASTSAAVAPGSSLENTNGRLANHTLDVGNSKAQQSTALTTTAGTINRAAINGTGLGRLGSGPAIVRGPAKSVGQINGATIRAKP